MQSNEQALKDLGKMEFIIETDGVVWDTSIEGILWQLLQLSEQNYAKEIRITLWKDFRNR